MAYIAPTGHIAVTSNVPVYRGTTTPTTAPSQPVIVNESVAQAFNLQPSPGQIAPPSALDEVLYYAGFPWSYLEGTAPVVSLTGGVPKDVGLALAVLVNVALIALALVLLGVL